MELWIRTQDKEALKKVNMGVMYWKDIDDRNCIVNIDNATGYSIVGAYKTKERALEVLDEIHKLVEDLLNYDHLEYKVYSMPKE